MIFIGINKIVRTFLMLVSVSMIFAACGSRGDSSITPSNPETTPSDNYDDGFSNNNDHPNIASSNQDDFGGDETIDEYEDYIDQIWADNLVEGETEDETQEENLEEEQSPLEEPSDDESELVDQDDISIDANATEYEGTFEIVETFSIGFGYKFTLDGYPEDATIKKIGYKVHPKYFCPNVNTSNPYSPKAGYTVLVNHNGILDKFSGKFSVFENYFGGYYCLVLDEGEIGKFNGNSVNGEYLFAGKDGYNSISNIQLVVITITYEVPDPTGGNDGDEPSGDDPPNDDDNTGDEGNDKEGTEEHNIAAILQIVNFILGDN